MLLGASCLGSEHSAADVLGNAVACWFLYVSSFHLGEQRFVLALNLLLMSRIPSWSSGMHTRATVSTAAGLAVGAMTP